MNQIDRQGRRWTLAKLAIASLAGLVVFVLLFPGSGVTPQPPQCYSVFGYSVPCESGVAAAAGVATAGVVGLLLWIAGRKTQKR
jgi:hypothetical protein